MEVIFYAAGFVPNSETKGIRYFRLRTALIDFTDKEFSFDFSNNFLPRK